MTTPLTPQGVIEQYYTQRPKMVWLVGRSRYAELRKLKDDTNRYLLIEGHPIESATLLGVPLRLVDGDIFELAVDK